MQILLAGEGKTELGEWAKEFPFREQPGEKGVLVALIERLGVEFTVADAVLWKNIRKYQAGKHASAEERNVLGLALSARRSRHSALVFSRDRDGSPERERDMHAGIARARELFADLRVVGGVAIENIEAWILVLLGSRGESIPSKKTKDELARLGITTLQGMVETVAAAPLDRVPEGSLKVWLDCARATFVRAER